LTKNSDTYRKDVVITSAMPMITIMFNRLWGLINNGEITPAENQAAATVLKNSERAFS